MIHHRSGPVRYDQSTGSRLAESATYLVKNLVPNAAGDGLDLLEVGYESKLVTGEPGWTLTQDFIFYDGTATPPSDGILDTQVWERSNINADTSAANTWVSTAPRLRVTVPSF